MKDADLMDEVDRNLVDTWRTLVRLAGPDGVQVEEDDDLLLMSTDTPLPFFNPVFLKRPQVDAAKVRDRIRRFFGTIHEPFLVWVREGRHAELVDLLVGEGMRVTEGPPPMALRPLPEAPPAPPAELDIVEVRATDLLESTADVVAAGFGLPVDLTHRIIGPAVFDVDSVAVFAGCIKGFPVTSASLFVTEGTAGPVAGIYNVATPQPNRGRGYGEAVTWAAVAEGRRRGCTMAGLQASHMGLPIYERMGFRTVGGYRHLVGGP